MNKLYKQQLKEAANFLYEHDHYLIVSHVQPDGDTISSSLGMAHILKYLKKSFVIVNQDEIPDKFTFLNYADTITPISSVIEKYKYIITLDVADKFRTGDISHLVEEHSIILNIDHHPTNDCFGNINVILSEAAATAEIIFDLVKEMNIPMETNLATCIYTGLLTDTGGFRYSNTTPKVMRIASELLEFDVSPGEIAEIALETITKGHIEILKKALERLEVSKNGLVAFTTLRDEDLNQEHITNEDSEGIVNYTRNIQGVEVGILFKEVSVDEIKVSMRSKRFIDVGLIAKEFGGGGHSRASGFTYHGDLDHIVNDLLQRINQSEGWN